MKPNPVALLIDAELAVRRFLRVVLESQSYKFFEAENGEKGIREAVARRPDVILMDLVLPDLGGMTVLRRLREWSHTPILIVSAETGEDQKVKALDGGANDYLVKPFGTDELLARLRVLQRLDPGQPDGPLYINGNLRVDISSHIITVGGRNIDLTPTEEALFYTLARHAGALVTCKHLIRCAWGTDSENKAHDLHVYIRSLRGKLRGAKEDILIQTEGSLGYRLLIRYDSTTAPAGLTAVTA